MKLHIDLGKFASVHEALFVSEALHEEVVVYHM